MVPVFFSLGPGNQAAFGVVVHHGGGQAVFLIEPDHLAVHIAEDLVHIQGEVRQLVPGHRALGPQPLQQNGQIIHACPHSFACLAGNPSGVRADVHAYLASKKYITQI